MTIIPFKEGAGIVMGVKKVLLNSLMIMGLSAPSKVFF